MSCSLLLPRTRGSTRYQRANLVFHERCGDCHADCEQQRDGGRKEGGAARTCSPTTQPEPRGDAMIEQQFGNGDMRSGGFANSGSDGVLSLPVFVASFYC